MSNTKNPVPRGRFRTAEGDIDFMSMRFWFIGLSMLLTVISAIALYWPGPKLGTDFVGGTEVELAFKQPVDVGKIREVVANLGFHEPEVVQVASRTQAHQFIIRVKEVSAFSHEQQEELSKALCLEHEGEAAKLDEKTCPEEIRAIEVSFSPGGEKVAVRYKQDACPPIAELAKPSDKPEKPGATAADRQAACAGKTPREAIAKQLSSERLAAVGIVLHGMELQPSREGHPNPKVQNVRDNRVEFFFKGKGDLIMDGLRAQLGSDTVPEKELSIVWVGPKAGKQLRDAAIASVLLTVIFIVIYIAFRFDFRFAPGAVLALMHDVFICLGAMILARREVTLSTVAALLTVLGYSINDTVIVYDRIRENLGKHRGMSFPKLINRSITEMLSRTIKTSATIAISLVPFLWFGTGTIKDFSFALLVGIAVGTYSSIYVAAPLTEYLDRRFFAKIGAKPKKARRVPGKGPTRTPPERAGAAA
jgi:preprotein translocase subunit SecF